jgi:uncharacterized protein YbjT (DUF2867 family)
MTYLVTGATGDVGSKVVRHLQKRGERPRLFVRDRAKAEAQFGAEVDYFVGDLSDQESLTSALRGVDGFLLVTSGPRIPILDQIAVGAALAAGGPHIVKLSSLDVEEHLAIGAWHEQGETTIRDSGLPFTFVRPTGFMSNLLAWTHSVRAESIVRASTGDGRRPFIHSEDIGAVATEALVTRKYVGESLAITGPRSFTFSEVAAEIGAAIGRHVDFEPISDEEAGRRFAMTGASGEEVTAHVELWRAIREGRLATTTDGVEQILGRKPILLDQWLIENAEAFR